MSAEQKRKGPKLTISASCFGCEHETSERYFVEDGNDVDSGCDVFCTYYIDGERRHIGDTRWDTPEWCPLLANSYTEWLKKRMKDQ